MGAGSDEPNELWGASPAFARVRELCERFAATALPVLVEGEPGTGKRTFARAVHARSARRAHPFVVVGPERAERGAALLDLAREGTLYVESPEVFDPDALSELHAALTAQARAPRTRVIAGTAADLRDRVRAKAFPEELYFALAVLRVTIPPLRERRDDVPDLLRRFLARQGSTSELDTPVVERLVTHDWPGNVTQLETVARTLASLGERPTRATLERLLAAPAPPSPTEDTRTLRDIERAAITARLRAFDWHQDRTARSLGIDRKTLYRKVREYGIERDL